MLEHNPREISSAHADLADMKHRRDRERIGELRKHTTDETESIIKASAAATAAEAGRNDDLVCSIENAVVAISDYLLQKLVVELVDNALRFSYSGADVIVVGQSTGHNYVLTVSDHGRGLTSETAGDVETPAGLAGQVDQMQEVSLGLTIARRIVELHGGKVRVTSRPGRGSRVHVLLPCSSHERADSNAAASWIDAGGVSQTVAA